MATDTSMAVDSEEMASFDIWLENYNENKKKVMLWTTIDCSILHLVVVNGSTLCGWRFIMRQALATHDMTL